MSAAKEEVLPWLGQTPADWKIKPLYALGLEVRALNRGLVEDNLLSLSYGEIKRKDIEANFGLLPESFETYQVVEAGDMVFRFTDLQNDQKSLRSALVKQRGIITNAYVGFRPKGIDSRYFNYLMRAYDIAGVFYSMGSGLRQSLNYSDVRRLPVVVPPGDEQRRIADFLDHETAKIDALIAKQEQLITTLDERRRAFINDGITGKLTGGNQRKPTGIPWLGGIPDSWVVKKFRHIASDTIGLTYSPDDLVEEGAGTLVLRAGNVHRGRLIHKDDAFVSSAVPSHLICRAGDIVVCARSGSRSLVGKSGMVTEEFVGASFGAFMTAVRSPINDYLFWVLNSHLFLAQLGAFETSTINQLTSATLRGFPVPLPPEAERNRIVNLLNEGTDQIDALTAKAQQTIQLLSERRQALISAAVTGKLEVVV